jgi:hypothetical protein
LTQPWLAAQTAIAEIPSRDAVFVTLSESRPEADRLVPKPA